MRVGLGGVFGVGSRGPEEGSHGCESEEDPGRGVYREEAGRIGGRCEGRGGGSREGVLGEVLSEGHPGAGSEGSGTWARRAAVCGGRGC